MQAAVTKILHQVEGQSAVSAAEAVDEFLPELGVARAGGLSYGIRELDEQVQPPEAGDMIVIAARPNIGKTVLAETIADNLARGAQYPVLFASLEMSRKQLTQRAIARYGDIDHAKIKRGDLSPAEQDVARRVANERRSLNLLYEDRPGITTDTLRLSAATVKAQHGGVTAIVVDYLGLLGDQNESEYVRVTRISKSLKQLAREMQCPLIVLSQLNRQSDIANRRPKLSDIRDSGSVEQDADVVIGLSASGKEERVLELLKNRSGPAGDVLHLPFSPSRVRIG